MKILSTFLAVIVGCLLSAQLHAMPVYNLISRVTTEKSEPAAPKIEVQPTADGYKVTLTIEEVGFVEDGVYSGRYFIEIPGFGQSIDTGKPSLPGRTEMFYQPKGTASFIRVDESSYVDFSKLVAPGRAPEFGNQVHTTATVPVITSYSGFTSDPLAKISGGGIYRGERVLNVSMNPVRYSHSTGVVRVYNKIVYRTEYGYLLL